MDVVLGCHFPLGRGTRREQGRHTKLVLTLHDYIKRNASGS